MTSFQACTIVARNYWAHARVLAASIAEHHPDVRLKVLVIDASDDDVSAAAREAFDVIHPDELGFERSEFHRMAAMYDVLELCTAVKPWLLRTLLKDDPSPVLYLDPDIEIFASVEEAADLADARGIVLTPHTLESLPRDGYEPSELTILGSGTYNLGFIAVGRDSIPFLDWWSDHLRRDGLISKEESMFVDQRWVDLAPSLFDVHILRDPGWNVAYWNLAQRPISRFGNRYEVGGRPLRFFHYSGFDPDRPRLSLFHSDNPRVRLDDEPIVLQLCERYASRLIDAGYRGHTRLLYGFGQTSTGLTLDSAARRLYRRELIKAERAGSREPPNPFEPEARDDFESWLRDRVGGYGVTRYLQAIRSDRPDLQGSFRELDGKGGRALVAWAHEHGVKNGDVSPRLLGPEPVDGERPGPGVNVAGYMRAESGVGEAARLLVAALDAVDVPHSIVAYDNTSVRQQADLPHAPAEPIHPIDVICVNADQLHHFLTDVEGFAGDRHRIAVWAWEVSKLPEWMGRSAELVDEIWTYSAHAAHAIREATSKPVHVVPPPILRPDARPLSRGELGLPEGFVFLFAFDFDSVFERKNPVAVIEAFSRGFNGREDVHLVIKTVRGDAHPQKLDRLRSAADVHPNVSVRDGYMTREEHQALVAACDAFVSLHRAEGYGLHLAEAMAQGKPVVATGYSGNLEFMDESNSRLVPFELVAVPPGCDPYPTDAYWAEPDLAAAADAMREIADDPGLARTLGENAAADIARLHTPDVRGRLIVDLLGRVPGPAAWAREQMEPAPKVEDDVLALDEVFERVRSGPGVGAAKRWAGLSRVIRRNISRLTRHTTEHQQRIDLALTHEINHLAAELDEVREHRKAIDDLTAQIRDLNARLIKEREYRRELDAKIRILDPTFDPRSAGGGDEQSG